MGSVWQAAMDIEKKGLEYYRQLAAESPFEELKGVFTLLADEEQRHHDLFAGMEQGMPVEAAAGPNVVVAAKDAFGRMAKALSAPDAIGDAEEAYAHALKFEQASIDYYEELLGKTDNDLQRATIETVLAEEKRHRRLVQGLLEFVRRPKEWVENAEFYHLEEY